MGKLNSKNKFRDFILGKGFYVALALCLVGTGVATWVVVDHTLGSLDGDISGASLISQISGEPTLPTSQPNSTAEVVTPQSNVPVSSTAPSSSSEPPTSSSQSQDPSASSQNVSEPTSESDPSGEVMRPYRQEFILPVSGKILTDFSDHELVFSETMDDWRTHDGIDIAATEGTEVQAAGDGTILQVVSDDLWGRGIVIEHDNGLVSYYYSLDQNVVLKAGDKVTKGQVIGTVGNTALCEVGKEAHLHFGVKERDDWIDPIDLVS